MPLSPVGVLTVLVLDPAATLVPHMRMNVLTGTVAGPDDRAVLEWSWAFVLVPTGDSSCRLIARVRGSYRPCAVALLLMVLVEPVHLLMKRELLRTLASRAQRRAPAVERERSA